MDDITQFDPELVKGATVTLHGQQALTYVRSRWDLEDSTNLHRMERQQQYLQALGEALRKKMESDEDFANSIVLEVLSSIESDCTVNKLSELVQTVNIFEPIEIITIDGESVLGQVSDQGTQFMEYYVNEEDLKQKVLSLFFEKTE